MPLRGSTPKCSCFVLLPAFNTPSLKSIHVCQAERVLAKAKVLQLQHSTIMGLCQASKTYPEEAAYQQVLDRRAIGSGRRCQKATLPKQGAFDTVSLATAMLSLLPLASPSSSHHTHPSLPVWPARECLHGVVEQQQYETLLLKVNHSGGRSTCISQLTRAQLILGQCTSHHLYTLRPCFSHKSFQIWGVPNSI